MGERRGEQFPFVREQHGAVAHTPSNHLGSGKDMGRFAVFDSGVWNETARNEENNRRELRSAERAFEYG